MARNFLATQGGQVRSWIAVQVGASDPMKAWRPELFGQTLAALSRQTTTGMSLSAQKKNGSDSPQNDIPESGGTARSATRWERRRYRNLPPCSPSADSC